MHDHDFISDNLDPGDLADQDDTDVMQLLKDFSYLAANGEQWLALTVSTVDAASLRQGLAAWAADGHPPGSGAPSTLFLMPIAPDARLLPSPKLIQ